jgi:hypothetical protein
MTGVFAGLLLCLAVPADDADEESVKVTVVVVLATDQDRVVDPKLVELARQVRKRDPKLTGFKLWTTEVKSIPIGESAAIPLVEKQELKVKVEAGKDEQGRVTLTLKAPELPEVGYACKCDKFFPIATPYRTAKGEQLILAVMGKPAAAKK